MSNNSKGKLEKAKIFPFIPTGEYYFNRGIKAYDRFDMQQARKYLKRALELEPSEPIIACQLAIVLTEIGEYEESNHLLKKVLTELDEQLTECYYFMANNFAHLGMFTEAYKNAYLYLELDQTGEFSEEAKELLDLIGIEDEENFTELLEQDAMFDKLDQARELLQEGHFSKAIELLEKTVSDYPELWPAYNNLALAYFYEGKTKKAFEVLKNVLENSPGNLHALCNLAVFLYYEEKNEELEELLDALHKVQPIHFEHRYKLGATFALAGKYEQAYHWLRHLQKYGYEGDYAYYYWLAKAAYFTGNQKVADDAWLKLIEINPLQAEREPWKVAEKSITHLENDEVITIMKWLQNEHVENRLYGIFLISVSTSKSAIYQQLEKMDLNEFTLFEKRYLTYILQTELHHDFSFNEQIKQGHESAMVLFEKYQAQAWERRSVLLLWFRTFLNMFQRQVPMRNPLAMAGAIEYIWSKNRHNKKTQLEIATEYSISTSTLRKYVRLLQDHLD
ncbi:tetratricopeptide repeat protein [Lederbergia sp. NSJ-179]|uniref:tetratricopeptide repeat protein n=1 Tax=Lederbergia sp. NSJ-179 TaxID=2931402 RepID=UPI001FD4E1D7|nr:tetratricopeptide repeat protein [Lederbergia sp. NSJ-179]MCJ7840215.1 tetratricopeptide repeat protein [Lederbergia sp. NSJ-179]